MGLTYKTGKWLDQLWSEHLKVSESAREMVRKGIGKQGKSFAGFPADIHARLYLPNDPPIMDTAPSWAEHLHTLASELNEWQMLKLMCAKNGFASAIAAETVLEHLLPHVPERPRCNVKQSRAETKSHNSPQSSDSSNDFNHSDSEIRSTLRSACRRAQDSATNAEADIEGLTVPLGLSLPGTAVVKNTGPADLKRIRDVHERLKNSNRLKRISTLAGRLERITGTKARSKIKPGIGEMHSIEMGSDISKLLPSELQHLRHRRLRLSLLAKLVQGLTLVYAMAGKEPQGRGPIITLLDESSSMISGGKDIWSKAVCLALLSTATRQKRPWHLVAFNGDIVREVSITGRASIETIIEALDHNCQGGTDFNLPILRAVNIINSSKIMNKADVVMITDGEAGLDANTVEIVRALSHKESVSWFVIGIGPSKQTCGSLSQIATHTTHVRDLDDHELIAPIIAL